MIISKEIEIKYKNNLTMMLDSDCEPTEIHCDLPVIGEGNNRIVYDLGDKVLKVAKSSIAAMYNQNENRLWQYLGEKSKKIKINEIFEIDENGYWYVAEKVKTGNNDAMDKALQYNVAKTEYACSKAIILESSLIKSEMNLSKIRQFSEQRKAEGDVIYKSIRKTNRRDGYFIDELKQLALEKKLDFGREP